MRLAKVRWLLIAFTIFLATVIVYVVKNHNYKPDFIEIEGQKINEDVRKQLRFIELAIDSGAADQMQQYYPEGYVFTLCLYRLAHVEILSSLSPNNSQFKKSQHKIKEVLASLNSQKAKSVFQKHLLLPCGTFYNGWINYLKAEFLMALPDSLRSEVLLNELDYFSNNFSKALANSPSHYIESYAGMPEWCGRLM